MRDHRPIVIKTLCAVLLHGRSTRSLNAYRVRPYLHTFSVGVEDVPAIKKAAEAAVGVNREVTLGLLRPLSTLLRGDHTYQAASRE